MKRKNVFFKAGILLLSLLFLPGLVGCASFTAKPSTIAFRGASWKVGSAEIVHEFASMRPASESDVLFVVTFHIEGEPLPMDQQMALAWGFSFITLRDSNRAPSNILIGYTENGDFINEVQCVFVVDQGTKSVELLLPDSQIIEITLRR